MQIQSTAIKYLILLYKIATLLIKSSSSFKWFANDVQTHLPVDILVLVLLKQLHITYVPFFVIQRI